MLLPAAEFSYNNSKQKSTQETPFFLNYGMHPVTPLDRITNATTDVEAANDFLKTIKTANDTARAHLCAAQQRQKKGHDGRRKDHVFQEGDLVNLSPNKDTPMERRPAFRLKR